MDQLLKTFTFRRSSGNYVTYEGVSEQAAFDKACMYHSDILRETGTRSWSCDCPSHYEPVLGTRQAGWLICGTCAGLVGAL